jgi:glycosyltransferase involved in cell wall biosynthesis
MQSVLNQSFPDFELIVVDDLSSDDTMARVKSFADPRILYVLRNSNGGAAASRNTGIGRSRGQYIAFLDDDDELLPHFLEAAAQIWQQASPSIGLTWCGREMVCESSGGPIVLAEDVWMPKFDSLEEAYLAFLNTRQIGTADGLTVRRTVFDCIGLFDEAMRKAEDTDFLIRLARRFEFIVIPEVLNRRHAHSGPRLTQYDATMAEAYERIMAKNIETLQEHPELWAAKHYKTAWLYYHGGNKIKGRYHMGQALRMNSMNPKYWATWFLLDLVGLQGRHLHRRISSVRRYLQPKGKPIQ